MTNNPLFVSLVAEISTAYGCSQQAIIDLYEITSDMNKGAKKASIKNYSSDKSDHSEIADHSIILAFSYANMLKDDKETIAKFNVNSVDINKFNYDSIDLNGKDLNTFKKEVAEILSQAITEIRNPKKKDRVNNDIRLNDILVWNTETQRLSLFGQSENKVVIVEGEYKKTKSVPKTIAKKLIMKQANLRANKIRRYAIDNMNEVRLQGEVVEIY